MLQKVVAKKIKAYSFLNGLADPPPPKKKKRNKTHTLPWARGSISISYMADPQVSDFQSRT